MTEEPEDNSFDAIIQRYARDAQRRFNAAIRAADKAASGFIEDEKRHYIIQTARNEWNNPSAQGAPLPPGIVEGDLIGGES